MNYEPFTSIENPTLAHFRHFRHFSSLFTNSPLYICRESSTNQLLFMQNKPNLRKAKMNVNSLITTDYENIANWTIGQNKPNSNPIKPNFKGKKMTVTDFNSLINFGQIIFMETLKKPPLFIRVTHILSFLIECIICRFMGILSTVVPNAVTSVRKTHFLGTNTTGPDY